MVRSVRFGNSAHRVESVCRALGIAESEVHHFPRPAWLAGSDRHVATVGRINPRTELLPSAYGMS